MSQTIDVDELAALARSNKRPDHHPDPEAALEFAENFPATFLAIIDAARTEDSRLSVPEGEVLNQHEPAAYGASAPSEPPRFGGGES